MIRVSNRSNRFEKLLLAIRSAPLFRTSRFGLGAAPGTRTPQYLGPCRMSAVLIKPGVPKWLFERQPVRFAAPPTTFTKNFSRTRPPNFVTGNFIFEKAKASGDRFHGISSAARFPVGPVPSSPVPAVRQHAPAFLWQSVRPLRRQTECRFSGSDSNRSRRDSRALFIFAALRSPWLLPAQPPAPRCPRSRWPWPRG